MTPYEAGQQLGALVFGNGDQPGVASVVGSQPHQGSVYFKTLQQGASAQNAMQEARMNRAKALIQESMLASRQARPAAIAGVYTNPAQAALVTSIINGNATGDLRDLGQLQNPNAVQALGDAASAMRAGDFPAYNQNTALAAGKPFEPVRVADGIMMPSGVGLGDASFQAVGKPAAGQVIENGPIPQTAPAGLPDETVAYVPKVFNFLDGAPPFGADGQPTAQLLDAVRRVESNGNPNAVSPAGAQGPYQFMPATAASVGVANPFDETQARAGAAKYLGQLYQQFGGDARKAVAAYNAGPGTVTKLGDATIAAPATPQTGLHMATLPGAPASKAARVFTTMTPDQLKAASLPPDTVAQVGPNGQIHVIQKGTDGLQGGDVMLPGDMSLVGQAYLDSIASGDPSKGIAPDPATAQLAASYVNRTLPMAPSGTAIKNPQIRAAMLAAVHADPTLSAASYDIAKSTRKDAATGTIGKTIGAINTAIPHLRQLASDVVALDNGQLGVANVVENAARRGTNNFFQGATKGTPATNLTGDLTQVVSEMAQVYKASGATDEEIGQFRDAFPTNGSKNQQINVLRHWIGLLYGKLDGQATQYQNGMGGMATPLIIVNKQAQGALSGIQKIAQSLGMTPDELTAEAQDALVNGGMPGGLIPVAPQQFRGPGAQSPAAVPGQQAAPTAAPSDIDSLVSKWVH